MSRLERIVAACGGVLLDDCKRALIPGLDHSAKDRSVSLMETDEGRILIHCFSPKDDWRAVRRALDRRGLLRTFADDALAEKVSAAVVQPAAEDRLKRAQRMWEEGESVPRTVAAAYLHRRHIGQGASSAALRFHPRMTSVDDGVRRPALLAAIIAATGDLQGVQVTLISKYGAAKAAVPTPRRTIGKLLGGAVRLAPAGDDALIIAEGVESALSAGAALGATAWAALTAYNLSLFEPPEGLKHLIVAPDADDAGVRASEVLRARVSALVHVSIEYPPDGADDWNSWARQAVPIHLP